MEQQMIEGRWNDCMLQAENGGAHHQSSVRNNKKHLQKTPLRACEFARQRDVNSLTHHRRESPKGCIFTTEIISDDKTEENYL
jgi:hypothetical protein